MTVGRRNVGRHIKSSAPPVQVAKNWSLDIVAQTAEAHVFSSLGTTPTAHGN